MAFMGIPLLFSMFFVFLWLLIIYVIIKFVLYIFQSFGLLGIAKKEKYSYPYLVWIPGISHYYLGKTCLKSKQALGYCLLTLLKIILVVINFWIYNKILIYIFLIYVLIYFIIDMLVMNRFYQKYYQKSELFIIFTVITFGLLKPIFIYTAKYQKRF